MKNNKLIMVAALLGTVLAGCQKEEENKLTPETVTGGWTLTVNATKGADTKAMSLSGNDLDAYWTEGEQVSVYLGGTKLGTLTAGSIGTDAHEAVLSGELESVSGITMGSHLMLLFPDKADDQWTYLGQDGSAPSANGSMATGFDYASADLEIASVDPENRVISASGSVSFFNQQGIYRLGFKANNANFAVKFFNLVSSQHQLVRTRSFNGNAWESSFGSLTLVPAATPQDNLYYMAVRNDNNSVADSYSFLAVRATDNALLEGTKNIPAAALAAPKFLSATVNMSPKTFAPTASETTISVATDVL